MTAAPKRGPAARLDEDGACPDCGVPGGHPEHDVAGLPRCPDNWTQAHLDRVSRRAENAYAAYEDARAAVSEEALDELYAEFRHCARDAEAVHLVVYSGRGHSWWWSL